MHRSILYCCCFWVLLMGSACKKQNAPAGAALQLSYGDSVFYIRSQAGDVLAAPVNARAGTFTAFPGGLVINPSTGVINVSQSEAGMKYRVSFKGDNGDTADAYIIVSGINFSDKYYHISQADTVAFPVYNADPRKEVPGGSFDDDRTANSSGCAMKTTSGQINLLQSIQNGLFGSVPQNNTRKDFEVKYRLDDASGKAENKIKIQIYYYDHLSDVPASLAQTVQDHQAMTLQPNNLPLVSSSVSLAARPRPPCIIVIGH